MKIQRYVTESPVFALVACHSRVLNRVNRQLLRERLSFLQALVLIAVAFEEKEPVQPSMLARTFQTSRGNISHCLTYLEKLGLLRRQLDESDARSYRIVLRPEGKKKALKLMSFFNELQDAFELKLGVGSVRSMVGGLRVMSEVLS